MVTGDGCWLWSGYSKNGRYGWIKIDGQSTPVHRAMYEWIVGPIPDGLTIDHLCRNTFCVNPLHMEPVTVKENILRSQGLGAINARKTHCKNGHEFTPENTRTADGRRSCRECAKEAQRRYRARLR